MNKKSTTLISVLLLFAIWEVIAGIVNNTELFPSVIQLIKTLATLFSTFSFYQSVGITVLRGLTGMVISTVSAIFFAFLFSRYKWLYELFRPILSLMRSVPVISFILLALIFLHPESIPLIIAFLVMFPLLTENITKGILNLHEGYRIMAKVFRIKGRNRLFHIYYPQLKPFIYSGLSSAMGFGWRAIIMGEVLAQCDFGIGSEMKRAQTFIEIPELLAWTVIAIAISYLFDKGIALLEKYRPRLSFPLSEKIPAEENRAITIKDISFSYSNKHIFSGFSCLFDAGKIYGISAPSGAGKTTLLNLINGILTPGKGSITNVGKQGIANVFQEPELLPGLSVSENILLPLTNCYTYNEALKSVNDILSVMEMEAYKDHYPAQLSYGQQQRAAIARALVFPSPILLMDESFKGLDSKLIQHIISYIRQKQAADKQTIIFTSHKQEELDALADEVIVL